MEETGCKQKMMHWALLGNSARETVARRPAGEHASMLQQVRVGVTNIAER